MSAPAGLAIFLVAALALVCLLAAVLLHKVSQLQRELSDTYDHLADEIRARIIAQGDPRC
jgi:hypothetical protein